MDGIKLLQLREAILEVLYAYSDGEIGNDEAIDKIIALFS